MKRVFILFLFLFSLVAVTNAQSGKTSICPDANHPHMIDMGSGGVWSCCNIGASKPEDYGSYFAWGELEPKPTYTWENYKWWEDKNNNRQKDENEFPNVGKSIAGNKLYDVATVKLGNNWAIPTQKKFMTLLKNTTRETEEVNGVRGIMLQAQNGNKLFFPYTGVRDGKQLLYSGKGEEWEMQGCYWSATPIPTLSPQVAFYFSVGGFTGCDQYYDRSLGLAVRPVIVPEEEVKANEAAELAEKAKKEASEKLIAEKTAEFKRKLPGKWKITRLFNDGYNRMDNGISMVIDFKADGTYYETITYTSPAVKKGMKVTFGVSGNWKVIEGGQLLLDWQKRYLNPKFSYTGTDPYVRHYYNKILNMSEGEQFIVVSGIACNNTVIGGESIFSYKSAYYDGNRIANVTFNGSQLTGDYYTSRPYGCTMVKVVTKK